MDHVINFICLIAKQYIYRQRCLQRQIGVNSFLYEIRHIENVEKYIAIKNGHLSKHNKKWCKNEFQNQSVNTQNLDTYIQRYLTDI